MGVSKHMGDIQTYRRHPNICGGVQTYGPIQAHREASKHMGASKCIGAYGHPFSLTKHAFFVLCMYRGHPNIIKTYREHPNMCGGVQTCGGIHTYRGHSCMPSYPAKRVFAIRFYLKSDYSFLLKNFCLKSDDDVILNI